MLASDCRIFVAKLDTMDMIADAINNEYLDLLRTLSDLHRAPADTQGELKDKVAGKEEQIQKLILLSKRTEIPHKSYNKG